MPSNIEIKASLHDESRFRNLAQNIADGPPKVITQEDIFFIVPKGRLKLRMLNESLGELISYERKNSSKPKLSSYLLTKTQTPDSLKETLASALGILGVIRKTRWLYMAGQTRIHLDSVEQLGWFVELEVMLSAGQTVEEGTSIAYELMKKLEIPQENLVECAYIDLLLNKP